MGKAAERKMLKLSPHALFRILDADDGILINLCTKNYYSLNQSACIILNGVQKGLSKDEILKLLKKRFDATSAVLSRDLSKTLTFLKKEGFVQ